MGAGAPGWAARALWLGVLPARAHAKPASLPAGSGTSPATYKSIHSQPVYWPLCADPATGRFAEGTRCSSTQRAWLLMQNNCSQPTPYGLRVRPAGGAAVPVLLCSAVSSLALLPPCRRTHATANRCCCHCCCCCCCHCCCYSSRYGHQTAVPARLPGPALPWPACHWQHCLQVHVTRYSDSQCSHAPGGGGSGRLPAIRRIMLGVGCGLLAFALLAAVLRRLQRRRTVAAVMLTPMGPPPPVMPSGGGPPAGYPYGPPPPYPASAAWPPAPPGQLPPPPGQGSYHPSPGGHSPPPMPVHYPPPLYTATVGAPGAPAMGSPVALGTPGHMSAAGPSGSGFSGGGGGAPSDGAYPKV